jgi:potassium channel subfamily K, other eukaryote
MFVVKGLFHIASEGVKLVTNRSFGSPSEDVRNTDADAQLFDPVLSETTPVVDNSSRESTPLLLATTNNDNSENTIDQQAPSLTSEYMNVEHSSRILWLFLLHALIYYTLAVIGFSYIVQSWTIIDSLYYGTVLFCTIGFGDIEPDNSAARLYTIFLALYGIAFLGILLGAVIDYCLDCRYVSSEQQRRKVGTQVLHRMQQTDMMRRDDTDAENVVDEATDDEADSSTTTECTAEKSLWEEIFALVLLEIPVLSFVILLAIGVGHFEGWSVFNSIYWFVISGTTVGFGDFYPRNINVKLFCVFYLPMAVAVLGDLLGRIVTIYMDRKRRRLEKEFLSQSLTLVDLGTMDVDHDGRVDKAEFLSYMLCALQKVSKEDVDGIMDLFFKLDVDGSGSLTKSDLISRDWEDAFRSSIEKSMPKRVRNSR